ncbi:hypothetical protein RRX38_03735 [Pseudomonas sp. DTU_2021_1001937_2_SI_NGA_ILE_001]|uniref:hypothetical protein n=1 Tax=Pseudomonas sp. DTU_2021_1001937_2_SI_NGA_ILE_001 TaxID=3077589 RepID=UPI0028FC18F6|nr:hypothetical protein [Pseudomonas sp. DTU_2021_1001937_2_SI_NGA_ILE_001]WNW10299.1 hypothetical protein RRX38_03735 [Pseudomonas sp. DTU_2021_1001937_2_SI_NGA_ILE_001]
MTVTLLAAFCGWKAIPWFAWAHNNLNPVLVLHADEVEYRVLRRRRKPYAAIQQVDYREMRGTRNVVLEFHDSVVTFIGNTGRTESARQVVQRLKDQGCPLSERAEALLVSG